MYLKFERRRHTDKYEKYILSLLTSILTSSFVALVISDKMSHTLGWTLVTISVLGISIIFYVDTKREKCNNQESKSEKRIKRIILELE